MTNQEQLREAPTGDGWREAWTRLWEQSARLKKRGLLNRMLAIESEVGDELAPARASAPVEVGGSESE
mgnify:CR=1 FL=1